MKKTLLAVAAITGFAGISGAATFPTKYGKVKLGVKTQIYGQIIDNAANQSKDSATDFTIQNARIYLLYTVDNKTQVAFPITMGVNFDFPVTGAKTSHEATSTAKVRDAFINFHLHPMLNVMAGYTRVPFSRTTLTDRYDTIFMPQDGWVNLANAAGVYKNQILPTLKVDCGNEPAIHLTADNVLGAPTLGNAIAMTGTTDAADFSREAGVTIWGSYQNAAVTYYVGIYDSFGDHNAGEVVNGQEAKDNLGFAFRVQVSPMAFFSEQLKGVLPANAANPNFTGEGTEYYLKETYLGKRNVSTIGFGYAQTKLDVGAASFTFKSWTIDANYEAKVGAFVPKVELAYAYTDGDNLPLMLASNPNAKFRLDSVKSWYITLGGLYDQKLLFGKAGAYIKYQKVTVKTDTVGKIKPSIWTFAIPYYLAGQKAKVVLQFNKYDYDRNGFDPRNINGDTNTDITLAFQAQF